MPPKKKKLDKNQSTKYKLDIVKAWDMGRPINQDDEIANMSMHIQANAPNSYTGYYGLSKEEKERRAAISHHAIASQESQNGDNVLSFVIAGSGNTQWNKVYKNLSGYNEVMTKEKIRDGKKLSDESLSILTTLKDKYRAGTLNPKDDEEKINALLLQEYGNPKYVDSEGKVVDANHPDATLLTGYREKKKGTHTTVNLSGPLAMNGASNSGTYSIENLEKYVVNYADNWLKEKSDRLAAGEDLKPIHIHIKGHSRGGVAANESAAIINQLVETKYPQLKKYVDFELALYDPVPGFNSYKEHATVDHTSAEINTPNGKGKGLNSEPNSRNNVTVIYSLISNNDFAHRHFFAPQQVKGANRVIMTGKNHNVGIYDIEDNHKASYVYAGNGERYRGTGLAKLPDGIYFADENNTLAKVKNAKQAQDIADSAIGSQGKITRFFQRFRAKLMGSVIKDHFTRKAEVKDFEKGNRAHNNRVEVMSGLIENIERSNKPNARAIDTEGIYRNRIADMLVNRIAETEKVAIDRSKNIDLVMADPSFKLMYSGLKSDDIEALTNDYDAKKIDQLISQYTTIKGDKKQSPEEKLLEARVNKITAAETVDPLVFAKLVNDGFAPDKILSPVILGKEKQQAMQEIEQLKLSAEGKAQIDKMLVDSTAKIHENMSRIQANMGDKLDKFLTDLTVGTVTTGQMLGRLAAEFKNRGIEDANKELASKAKDCGKFYEKLIDAEKEKLYGKSEPELQENVKDNSKDGSMLLS